MQANSGSHSSEEFPGIAKKNFSRNKVLISTDSGIGSQTQIIEFVNQTNFEVYMFLMMLHDVCQYVMCVYMCLCV